MRNFKKIAACLIAVVTMASTSITARADSWSINYTQGAPSDISNQCVRKVYEGYTENWVMVTCDKMNSGGKVEFISSGFSPDITCMFTQAGMSVDLKNPSRIRITMEFWARTNTVNASGSMYF